MAQSVILIAGNIGSGKTGLVNYLEQKKKQFDPLFNQRGDRKVTIVPESIDPVALKWFYHNRKAYSLTFEISCLAGRIARHTEAKHDSGIYLFDRGMVEGAETFSKNSCLEGYLSHADHQLYQEILKRGLDLLDRNQSDSWLERLIVYLRVNDPKILQERQRKRGTRNESIPLSYFRAINDRYEELFWNIKAVYGGYGLKTPEVLEIDASVDFNQDPQYHQKILEQVVGKLEVMLSGK